MFNMNARIVPEFKINVLLLLKCQLKQPAILLLQYTQEYELWKINISLYYSIYDVCLPPMLCVPSLNVDLSQF